MSKSNLSLSQLLEQLNDQKKELSEIKSKDTVSVKIQSDPIYQEPGYNSLDDGSIYLSIMILSFSLVVVFIVSKLFKLGMNSEAILKVFGTILIIVAAVFLIVAGYSEKQIAPVIGLLGTIVGYILAKQSTASKP